MNWASSSKPCSFFRPALNLASTDFQFVGAVLGRIAIELPESAPLLDEPDGVHPARAPVKPRPTAAAPPMARNPRRLIVVDISVYSFVNRLRGGEGGAESALRRAEREPLDEEALGKGIGEENRSDGHDG